MSLKGYSHFCRWCVFIGHEYIINDHSDVLVCTKLEVLFSLLIFYAQCGWSNGLLLFSSYDVLLNRKNHSYEAKGHNSESQPLVGNNAI